MMAMEGMWVRDSFLPWKGLAFSLFFWFMRAVCLLTFPFYLPYDGSSHRSFIGGFFSLCMCTISYGGFLCEEEGRLLHMSTISHIALPSSYTCRQFLTLHYPPLTHVDNFSHCIKLLQGKALVDKALLKFGPAIDCRHEQWVNPYFGNALSLTYTVNTDCI
jgi:hypothetical protein